MPMTASDNQSGTGPDLSRPGVVALDDIAALDPGLVGGKAAALARARRAGVPTLDGVALTTVVSDAVDGGAAVTGLDEVGEAYRCVGGGSRRLIARSSSVVEDQQASSAAGQFESVVGIEDLDQLVDAVVVVFESRERAGAADHPIAVLIQPMIEPSIAGVYFGVDPVSGRTDRRVVTAVAGQPDQLVSGEVDGSHYVLGIDAGVREATVRDDVAVPKRWLRELTAVGDRLAEIFDGPQDVEWAVVDDALVVLQSRPVTTEIRGVPQGALFGPGPVAETFPEPLSRLESDMWVPPLDAAVREALVLSGAHRADELAGRELVVEIDGWVAIDLEATGEISRDPSLGERLSPVKRIRRLRSAWRVGRLRAALPFLVDQLVDRVDADLDELPNLDDLSSRQLVALIGRTRDALRSVHAHEILMGLLSDPGSAAFTGASVALRVLAESRRDGLTDPQIIARSPVVLALVPPRVAPVPTLPESTADPDIVDVPTLPDTQVRRETLRLRVRWLQELSGQAAWKLGERLHAAGILADPLLVRHVDLADLEALVARRASSVSATLEQLAERHDRDRPPLPSRFRVSDTGRPIADRSVSGSSGGTGAGGGIAEGVVIHDVADADEGSVLVVGSLRPDLGPKLASIGAIVAETGSVLSHLAILAREQRVPTVVGYTNALTELAVGTRVRVNGDVGTVEMLDGDEKGSGAGEVTGS
jgi:rifampicin phosphotransferase